jgi:hypothetical protein
LQEEEEASKIEVNPVESRDWEQAFKDLQEYQYAEDQEKLEKYKKSITKTWWWNRLSPQQRSMVEGWIHFISLEKEYPAPANEDTQSEYIEKPTELLLTTNKMAANFAAGLSETIVKLDGGQKQKQRFNEGFHFWSLEPHKAKKKEGDGSVEAAIAQIKIVIL